MSWPKIKNSATWIEPCAGKMVRADIIVFKFWARTRSIGRAELSRHRRTWKVSLWNKIIFASRCSNVHVLVYSTMRYFNGNSIQLTKFSWQRHADCGTSFFTWTKKRFVELILLTSIQSSPVGMSPSNWFKTQPHNLGKSAFGERAVVAINGRQTRTPRRYL